MLSHSDKQEIQAITNKPLLLATPGKVHVHLNTSLRCIHHVLSCLQSTGQQ